MVGYKNDFISSRGSEIMTKDKQRKEEPEPIKEEPREEPEQEDHELPVPNEVSVQYGNIAVQIKSVDTDTVRLCEISLQFIDRLLGIEPAPQPDKEPVVENDETAGGEGSDLTGQQAYEKLMETIK